MTIFLITLLNGLPAHVAHCERWVFARSSSLVVFMSFLQLASDEGVGISTNPAF